ncbi:hypothetical protein KAF25_008698 [Fusarium avenaceum]|uniref:Ubiquitin-like domain-containing protein n=1 Tax=Fusarium avenaceum TaxID=40199 RepID=A0A9P7KX77_9HYPO|nr:hypothetical protein KAF25_008698 [Fusarium avenaceum]
MSPIIHCVRHGQGVHNLSHANHHLPDPELTPLGEEQARSLCAKYPKLANVQLIVSSPLRRTLQTALMAFPSQLEGGLQVLALPEMQEASNLICDTGRDLSEVKADFEQLPVNFDVVETGWHIKEDKWAPVASSLLKRAQIARQWLSERQEAEIVVTTHGCFLHFLTDDWINAVNSQATDWANAEVRSFTLTNDKDGRPAFSETKESRIGRGMEPDGLTEEQQLELRETTLKTWIEWGVILGNFDLPWVFSSPHSLPLPLPLPLHRVGDLSKMLENLHPWDPTSDVGEDICIDDLTITLKRIVRVPDNDQIKALPPDLGSFPLFKVDDYAESLADNMARKEGLFLPMYSLWISFKSELCYAIKIYVGGIIVLSGELASPTTATALRRRNLLKNGKTLQDYIVVPEQPWLDGMAVEPGQVRQFVAMPVGTGHSVEAHMTGEETTAGIQFEVTRLDVPPEIILVNIQTLSGERFTCKIGRQEPVAALKGLIQDKKGIPPDQQRIVWNGMQLGGNSNFPGPKATDAVLHLLPKLHGGGRPPPTELSIAAGRCITQSIVAFSHREYRKTVIATFNVQILNSASFEKVTGKKPQGSPVTAQTYAECGYPFFSIYEEPTSISGNFSNLQSVAEIDQNPDQLMPNIPIVDVTTGKAVPGLLNWTCNLCGKINNAAVKECEDCLVGNPRSGVACKVGLFNPRGPNAPLKLAWEMAEEVGQMYTVF